LIDRVELTIEGDLGPDFVAKGQLVLDLDWRVGLKVVVVVLRLLKVLGIGGRCT
jgi:hypothetical protein